jgi:hypothetical protein
VALQAAATLDTGVRLKQKGGFFMKKRTVAEKWRYQYDRMSDEEIRARYYAFLRAWFGVHELLCARYYSGEKAEHVRDVMLRLCQQYAACALTCLRNPSEAELSIIASASFASFRDIGV